MKRMHKARTVACGIALIALIACGAFFTVEGEALDGTDPFLPASDKTKDTASAFPEIDWEHWKSINRDIIGWVTIKATQIDCPIVQASVDCPTYYLSHDVRKNENGEGCAFLDAECAAQGLLSKNAVIFGHHLAKGRGFSAFADYSKESFANVHNEILLQTPDWQKTLRVAFVEITQGQSPTKVTSFEDEEQYRLWIRERYNASCVRLIDIDESMPSQTWTFCTCSYTTYKDERTLVYATEA